MWSPPTDCPWRLYVYSLPRPYHSRHRDSDRGGDADPNATFADNILPGYPGRLRLSGQYSLGSIWMQRALGHRCRTMNPSHADVFFVPAFNIDLVPLNSKTRHKYCAETKETAEMRGGHLQALFQRLTELPNTAGLVERHGGADHILLTPRVGAHPIETFPLCEVSVAAEVQPCSCTHSSVPADALARRHRMTASEAWLTIPCQQLDLLDSRWGAATRFAVEQHTPGTGTYTSHKIFRSVPRPSWVRLDETTAEAPWAHGHPRPTLVTAAFGGTSHDKNTSSKLRTFTPHSGLSFNYRFSHLYCLFHTNPHTYPTSSAASVPPTST